MSRDCITDEEVEMEIERIRLSEAYQLARRYTAYRNRRRELLYTMRSQEKLGLDLLARGYTLENFKDVVEEGET